MIILELPNAQELRRGRYHMARSLQLFEADHLTLCCLHAIQSQSWTLAVLAVQAIRVAFVSVSVASFLSTNSATEIRYSTMRTPRG